MFFRLVTALVLGAGFLPTVAMGQERPVQEFTYGRRTVRITDASIDPTNPQLKIWFNHAKQEERDADQIRRAYLRRFEPEESNPFTVEKWQKPLTEEERSKWRAQAPSPSDERVMILRFDFETPWSEIEELLEDYLGVYWIAEPEIRRFFERNRKRADALARQARDSEEDTQEGYLKFYDQYFGNGSMHDHYLRTLPLMEEFRKDVIAGKVPPPDERTMGTSYDQLTQEFAKVTKPALFVTHAERTLDASCVTTSGTQDLVEAVEKKMLPVIELLNPEDGLEGWAHQVKAKQSRTLRSWGGFHPFDYCPNEMTSVGNWFLWCQGAAFEQSAKTYFEKNPTGEFTVHIPTRLTLMPPEPSSGHDSPERRAGKQTAMDYLNRYGERDFLAYVDDHLSPEYDQIEIRIDGRSVKTTGKGPRKLILQFWHNEPHPILKGEKQSLLK